MRHLVFRTVTLACAGFAAAALGAGAAPVFAASSGNPLAGLTADQIVVKAFADLRASSAVRITGAGTTDGASHNLSLIVTKAGCETSAGLGHGVTVNILQIGSKAWTQLSPGYLKFLGYGGSQLSALEGKWLATTASEAQCELAARSDFPLTGWATVRQLTVGGKGAIELFYAGKRKLDQVYMDVSASATPEILRIFAKGSATNFSDYNVPVRLTPPPASEVVTSLPNPS
jgi:hypothetical protein